MPPAEGGGMEIFMSKELDYFGECLMNAVRDRTIHGFDLRITGKILDEDSIKLANTIQGLKVNEKDLISKIIPQNC